MSIKKYKGQSEAAVLKAIKEEMGGDPLIIQNMKLADGTVEITVADESLLETISIKPPKEGRSGKSYLADKPAMPSPKAASPFNDDDNFTMGLAGRPHRPSEDGEGVMVRLSPLAMRRAERQYSEAASAFAEGDETGLSMKKEEAPISLKPNAALHNAQPVSDAIEAEVVDEEASAATLTAVERFDKTLRKADGITQLSSDLLLELKALQQACRRDMMGSVSAMELFSRCYKRLISAGFGKAVAHGILKEIPATLTSGRAQAEEIASWLEQAVMASLPDSAQHDAWWGGDRVIALLGATGSGKSTCIAKLAARYLNDNDAADVVILSLDVDHVEPLSTFASVLGVDFKTVEAYENLPEVLESFTHKKLILIDTKGMGARHKRLEEQLQRLSACEGLKAMVVLNAAMDLTALDHMVEAYQRIAGANDMNVEHALITKLDESGKLGGVLNILISRKLALSYQSSGSDILDDFDRAAPMLLIRDAIDSGEDLDDLVSLFGREDQSERFESIRMTLLGNLAEMNHVITQTRNEFKRAGLLDPGRGAIGHFEENSGLMLVEDTSREVGKAVAEG